MGPWDSSWPPGPDLASVAASCWRRSAAGRSSSTSWTRWPRPGSGTSVVVLGHDAERDRSRHRLAWRAPGRQSRARTRPVELVAGRVRRDRARRRAGPRRPRRPAARLAPRSSARSWTPRRSAAGRSSCRSTPRIGAGTRSCVRRAAFGLVAEATGDRGLGPVLEAHPELVSEVAGRGCQPRHRHAGRPRPGDRGVLGRARPRQPRAGRAPPRGPRRRRLLRPGQLALPGRPDPDRRSGPGRVARARPVGRDVARRRRRRRTLRAADRARPRSVGRERHRARPVALDARGAARDRRGLRRRERPDDRGPLAARRTRAPPPTSRPTSR